MSYTRPSAAAADGQFSGSGYTRPLWSSADARFPSDFLASGATPSTAFGTPIAGFARTQVASGASTTTFGAARLVPGHVPGFQTGGVGAPEGHQRWMAASLGPLTKFPVAYRATLQEAGAAGFARTAFGTPVCTASILGIPTTLTSAAGFSSLRMGVPSGRKFGAAGWISAGLGAPKSQRRLAASPWMPTILGTPIGTLASLATGAQFSAFGTPLAGYRQLSVAGGWRSPRLGAPSTFFPHRASSVTPKTAAGTPERIVPGAKRAYGIDAGRRLGVPRSTAANGRHATPISPGASFGTATAKHARRVTHIAPGTTFGVAIVIRDGTC